MTPDYPRDAAYKIPQDPSTLDESLFWLNVVDPNMERGDHRFEIDIRAIISAKIAHSLTLSDLEDLTAGDIYDLATVVADSGDHTTAAELATIMQQAQKTGSKVSTLILEHFLDYSEVETMKQVRTSKDIFRESTVPQGTMLTFPGCPIAYRLKENVPVTFAVQEKWGELMIVSSSGFFVQGRGLISKEKDGTVPESAFDTSANNECVRWFLQDLLNHHKRLFEEVRSESGSL